MDESKGTSFSCEDCIAFIEESETVGFAIVDLDGKFLCVNYAYCKILNTTWRDIVGTTFQEWTHPKDLETDQAAAKELADGIAMSYGMFKTYVQRGSTEQRKREISGFLEVSAVWAGGKCHKYRVKFSPYGQTELRKTIWVQLEGLVPFLLANWKMVGIALLTVVSIFGGSELVTKILSAIATAQNGVESGSSP